MNESRPTSELETFSHPEIGVIVLTHDHRDHPNRSLYASLTSIARQDYPGPIRVLLLGDNCASTPRAPESLFRSAGLYVSEWNLTPGRGSRTMPDVAHVARLRSISLQLIDSPYVCFLDDDNVLEHEHLSTLYNLLRERLALATHSWRKLVDAAGRPWRADRFPWLPPGPYERRIYDLYTTLGVLTAGDCIVRDRVSLPVHGREYGMVDMGEWLFDRSVFDMLKFDFCYSQEEINDRTGEDDKLLHQIRRLGLPTACTERATLIYSLGGFSNRYLGYDQP